MNVLITATGREIKVASVTYDDFLDVIHLKVCDLSLLETVAIFSDENETSVMTYGETAYEGYTFVKAVSPTQNWIHLMIGKAS